MNKVKLAMGEKPMELLRRCGGFYSQPPGGPLVGYAGRYDKGSNGPNDPGKQYVGRVYVNFAKAERHGAVLKHFAECLLEKFPFITDGTGFVGAPEGGKALAAALAGFTGNGYIFPEKEVTKVKSAESREENILVWGRHEPENGEAWWIVEDVCNNFSTTKDLIKLVEGRGATVEGIVCFLNRSVDVNKMFAFSPWKGYNISALVRQPIQEFRQDSPDVIDDIAAGRIVWKPKNEWHLLEAAMQKSGS